MNTRSTRNKTPITQATNLKDNHKIESAQSIKTVSNIDEKPAVPELAQSEALELKINFNKPISESLVLYPQQNHTSLKAGS